MNTVNNIINSQWLVVALLMVSLILAAGLPQASLPYWLLALVGGGLVYLGIWLEDMSNPFSKREMLSVLLCSIGNFLGMAAVFVGPLGCIQFAAFLAGLLGVRLACYKGLSPWIQ
ncbi:hypothetical protein QZQ24_16170 [Serratia marcescens]|uniref:hypothetical protein n=1 Tax=Serratia marcescens TaxID=615 RepID=UPI00276E5269|nr:hypothetical protein [Serratia marcescens]MDP8834530.1 hypothetical protein [Serratia marcescens]